MLSWQQILDQVFKHSQYQLPFNKATKFRKCITTKYKCVDSSEDKEIWQLTAYM